MTVSLAALCFSPELFKMDIGRKFEEQSESKEEALGADSGFPDSSSDQFANMDLGRFEETSVGTAVTVDFMSKQPAHGPGIQSDSSLDSAAPILLYVRFRLHLGG
eukprot:CAMPEP_0113729894 /NCGR_PEP_ID=MMETSP0038_2-20120614/42838_1 /TAXON_ID=2898 /ORGANISM="Cryptomonas paramecium" /LENGTH=104 /DNA_ID=CAMNT_0000661857 /DNA_START=365 /DNA_END=679 /DNA_ORIENTATION=- /assembly_acc=CAM_ASM_000170